MMTYWEFTGRELVNCNCEYGCNCQFNALPDKGHCHAVAGIQIDQGYHGDTPLGVEGRVEFIRAGEEKPTVAMIPRRMVLTEPIRTSYLTAKLPDAATLPDGTYAVKAILDIGLDHYIGVQKRIEVRR